jgi:septation ring formation regulator EzrA
LAEVESLKAQETTIKADKARHLEAISAAETEVTGCNNALEDIRENQLRLRREMDSLRDDLFARPEDAEEVIAIDEAHVPTDGSESQKDNTAKRAWDARAKHIRQVQ